ncbi:MAG: ribosome maturation factor RimP [Cystobacterineae bacterium]|nr:ribosome maturation factor RimP [Cystobacterineae bacterium]
MSTDEKLETTRDKAKVLLEPLLEAEGYELVDIEYQTEFGRHILRLFIDKPGGVNLEDCVHLSGVIGPFLDVEDFIPQEYNLEVSSPGLNRPLTKPQHFAQVLGQKIRLKAKKPLGQPPRRVCRGRLVDVSETAIELDIEAVGRIGIAFSEIAKANVEYEF